MVVVNRWLLFRGTFKSVLKVENITLKWQLKVGHMLGFDYAVQTMLCDNKMLYRFRCCENLETIDIKKRSNMALCWTQYVSCNLRR